MDSDKRIVTKLADSVYILNDEARRLFEEAYEEQMNGMIENAMILYNSSIQIHPSAQAITYLGWAHSAVKEYEKAIELCKRAIEMDPSYGNPYNDIGAYLIQMGQEDDAIQWLERAIIAPKYHSKFFAYFNLGRVYETKNLIRKALTCYKTALTMNSNFAPAKEAHEKLANALN